MNKTIIDTLKVFEEYNRIKGEGYKASAYDKVINNIELSDIQIKTVDDLKKIKGVGKSILEKLEELLTTGKIAYIDDVINKDDAYILSKELAKIYGIGPANIKKLLENIKTFDDLYLPENIKLLNDKQQIGLKYYKDLELRIPRDEAKRHYNIIKKQLNNVEFEMVGSYRRGNKDIGDIDILIKNNDNLQFKKVIDKLTDEGYIVEKLSSGKNKFMGIVRLSQELPARRIDILVAEESYYYFALLYFTGSYNFNIYMRKIALEKGLSLSEYGFKDNITKKLLEIPEIKSEEDIFKYLKLDYVKPNKR